ncbi:protein-tyrosine phosphatase-like protein [Roridomyces roridus]|uniref:Protein-tyrosine phosphatase-like protein n=1 Tax=Roridomyces roridus TaxID=1738132 RepID=A0AAD7B5R9_9AGAR|nr:protein-tyrosine phosphatase-like protein [Roridomyces roridus]
MSLAWFPSAQSRLGLSNNRMKKQQQKQATWLALKKRESERAAIRARHLAANPEEREPLDSQDRTLLDYYSIAVGCENRNMNRYADVMPYDRTRVVVGAQRYLNASWCVEQFGGHSWIASQAPLPNTAHTFLSFIRGPVTVPGSASSTRIRTVVQLTRLVEGGRTKAHPYFPGVVGQSIVHDGYPGPPLEVTLVEKANIVEASCVRSVVSLSIQGDRQNDIRFQHLLYTAWPDQGVPELEEERTLLSFVRLVDSTNRQKEAASDDPDPPILVGCSAGIGRTGTFIAISSLLRKHGFLPPPASPSSLSLTSPLGELPATFDVVGREVDSLREQRPAMVQQFSQLELIYTLLDSALASEQRL